MCPNLERILQPATKPTVATDVSTPTMDYPCSNTKVSIIYQKLPGVPKSPLSSVPHVLTGLTVEQSMELHAVGRAGEKGASASEKPADIAESLQRISRSGRTLQQRKLFTLSTDACTESALPAWAPGMMPLLNWSMTCAPKLKVCENDLPGGQIVEGTIEGVGRNVGVVRASKPVV